MIVTGRITSPTHNAITGTIYDFTLLLYTCAGFKTRRIVPGNVMLVHTIPGLGLGPSRSWPIHVNAMAKRLIGPPDLCTQPLRTPTAAGRCSQASPLMLRTSTISLDGPPSAETRLQPHQVPPPL